VPEVRNRDEEAAMSELSERIRREREQSQRVALARLAEANSRFEIDVDAILNSRNGERKRAWPWWAKATWYLFCGLVLYACVWGIFAL
jgi:hypothetical protein